MIGAGTCGTETQSVARLDERLATEPMGPIGPKPLSVCSVSWVNGEELLSQLLSLDAGK